MKCRVERQGAVGGNAGEQRTERNRPSPDGVASPPFPLAGTQGQGGAASDTVGCPRSPSPTAQPLLRRPRAPHSQAAGARADLVRDVRVGSIHEKGNTRMTAIGQDTLGTRDTLDAAGTTR